MTLERMIEEARKRNGSHEASLKAARDRMADTNNRLAHEFAKQEVTASLLGKTCSL
ncbi:hypothetical protein V2K35_10580 [Pseudomonas alliivorans]|nr:hypothetical protein [Pseudomonas alliivorans]MEE4873641.1 hypothetical protein [Pseudomonas alliivorans]